MAVKARFVLSKSKALEQYKIVRQLADEVSYSVKTNPELVKILESTDSFFSIHFENSLEYIKDKGRVRFLAQGWNKGDLDLLFKEGVKSFVVDNENDLKVLVSYIEKNNHKISLLLRMRMKERTIHTERHFVYGFHSEQINELVQKLKENKNIGSLGIHFHRKSQNISEWEIKKELEEMLSRETLDAIDAMNIGGGLPVKYKNHNDVILPFVFSKIKELKKWLNDNSIKLIIEPGRFIAAPSIKLEAEIINIYSNNIIINCSVYNSAMDTFVVPIRLIVENELDKGETYTIKGYTPDSLDVFRYRACLANPKIGDKIVFLNAGAYTYAADFCGLEKLETVVED